MYYIFIYSNIQYDQQKNEIKLLQTWSDLQQYLLTALMKRDFTETPTNKIMMENSAPFSSLPFLKEDCHEYFAFSSANLFNLKFTYSGEHGISHTLDISLT
jgi:hypothetical protein